jgi:cyclophilin family peptidyl-prolyl cis-trans isomerase
MLAVALMAMTALAGCSDGGPGPDACDGKVRSELPVGQANHTVVGIATSEGCIVLELYDDLAPITVENFLSYVDEGFYTDLLFHRISEDFMVQTGGMKKDGTFQEATHPMIKNEAAESGLENDPYTLAMARMGRNPDGTGDGRDTATNQFFINVADNFFLDAGYNGGAGYSVFGTVIDGRDVVDAIEATPTSEYTGAPGQKCQSEPGQATCPDEEVDLFRIVRIE